MISCSRCGKFMKTLRPGLWACRCGYVRACISGPNTVQVMQDFANICLTNKKRKTAMTKENRR